MFSCNIQGIWFWPIVSLTWFLFSPGIIAEDRVSRYSFEEEPYVWLGRWVSELNVGPGMNAVGKHLRGSEFIGQDLTGARFDGCDLHGVRFIECDLSRASFIKASLAGAAIEGCGLEEANFSGAIINGLRLTSLYLSEEQLISTHSYKVKDLSNCIISACNLYKKNEQRPLVRYNFRNANLSDAVLIDGDFSDCDFTDASISGITLSNAKITAKQLFSTSNYKLRRLRSMRFLNFQFLAHGPCSIDGAINFTNFDLTRTHFRGHLLSVDFSGADISGCRFDYAITKEQLCSTKNYQNGNLARIILLGVDLSGCNLSRQNLTSCKFEQCNFTDVRFDDSIITDADFGKHSNAECKGLTLDQIKSTWNYKHGRMEGIVLPKEIAEALAAEKR